MFGQHRNVVWKQLNSILEFGEEVLSTMNNKLLICFIFFLLFISVVCDQMLNISLLIQWANNSLPRKDYEAQAFKLLQLWNPDTHNPSRTGLLCATTLRWNRVVEDILVENILRTYNFCSAWAVVVYESRGYNSSEIFNIVSNRVQNEAINENRRMPVTIITTPPKRGSIKLFRSLCYNFVYTHLPHIPHDLNPCDLIADIDPPVYFKHLYSKGSMYSLLLNHLHNFQYVWMLDSDISLSKFDLYKFSKIHQCAFDHPPIVAQPLISPATQYHTYLNRQNWTSHKILASEVGFIEIQAPFFEAAFFEWFLLSFMIPTVPMMQILGGDWGIDYLFCPAATFYLRHKLKREDIPNRACAIIIGDLAVEHVNTGSIKKNSGLNFTAVNIPMKEFYAISFPEATKLGDPDRVSPQMFPERFRYIEDLHSPCQMHY